jgi:hypothetical protein
MQSEAVAVLCTPSTICRSCLCWDTRPRRSCSPSVFPLWLTLSCSKSCIFRLIGINYIGQQGQLSGCHNDVGNIKKYLIKEMGFNESEMLILMDDGKCHPPTKRNIEDAFSRMTQYSKAGDIVFVHYSGHGGKVRDVSGDEVRI